MIYEIGGSSIDTSCESEDLDRWIESIFPILYLRTRPSSRSRVDDSSASLLHLDIHMRMRASPFMQESATDRLMGEDPLLGYLIHSLLSTCALHIV